MKKIIVTFIVLSLGLIAYFQYVQYRKFSPPQAYDYPIKSKNIDILYHDQALVKQYFEEAYRIGAFAREVWYKDQIDVRFAGQSRPQSLAAAQHYQHTLSRLKAIEMRLEQSYLLKEQGFDNEAIRFIEEKGIAPEQYELFRMFEGKILRFGEENAEVWHLQRLLNKKGYPVRIDGKFNEETRTAIKEFQEKIRHFPSGVADTFTLSFLLR